MGDCENDGKQKLSRQMIFPYTFTAKIVQFPFKMHLKHHWMFPWFMGAGILCLPVFYKLQQLANSESNVIAWAEKRRLEEKQYKEKWA
ncbi:Hypothetical protein CINCED_3A017605 [Cinara cedri]|uniref:Uncharacterized protein n=1 Tax=Cinara cedri TaxID=506608 RepID=A0A5E4NET3_9HEMI|nr:Hypothetical protein CINCED_3A017605 [Cinara cedri]